MVSRLALGLVAILAGCASDKFETGKYFAQRDVVVTYRTNDGPGTGQPLKPIDPDFVNGVKSALDEAGSSVRLMGNPTDTYMDLNLFLGSDRFGKTDYAVIADRQPNLGGIDPRYADRVYVAVPDGKNYKFQRIGKH